MPLCDEDTESIAFFQTRGTWLALYPRDALAVDVSISSEGSGFPSVTLAHNVRTRSEVDELLHVAVEVGAIRVKPAADTFWRSVKGINILNCVYHAQGVTLPVAFEIVRKTIEFTDERSGQTRRRSELTKNELMRRMLKVCVHNRVEFSYVRRRDHLGDLPQKVESGDVSQDTQVQRRTCQVSDEDCSHSEQSLLHGDLLGSTSGVDGCETWAESLCIENPDIPEGCTTCFRGVATPQGCVTSVSNLSPSAGDEVNVEVRVQNVGRGDSGRFTVSLYVDGADQPHGSERIGSLDRDTSVYADFRWQAVEGCHRFSVVVDGAEEVPEEDEGNNRSRELEICVGASP